MFFCRKILSAMLLLGLMTSACTKDPVHINVTPEASAQESCGDKGESEVWWPVFINNGDIEKIQQAFCRDAISTKRADGTPSTQLASFKTREEAQAFAAQVHGEVGSPSYVSKNDTITQSDTQNTDHSTDDTEQPVAPQASDNSTDETEQLITPQNTDNSTDYIEQWFELHFGRKPCAPTLGKKRYGCRGVWHTPSFKEASLITQSTREPCKLND